MSSTQAELKGKISITIEPPLQKAIYKIMAKSLQEGKAVSFSAVINDLAKKGLKVKA